jgi:drug/metabolite transporter (DMT)-like permease
MRAPPKTSRPEDAPFALLDWGLLVGAASIWGSSFLLMAIGLDSFEPGVVTLLRVGFGALTLSLIPRARGGIDRSDLPRIALLGFTWMAFPLTLFPIAQQWIDSSVAGMLNSGMPLMTVMIAWAVYSTSTGPRRLVGVVVGFMGIALIGIPEASTAGTNAIGVALVLVAVTSYGFAVNITGPLQARYGSLPVIAGALRFATVMTLPYGIASVPGSSFDWGALAACVVLGAAGTGVAFVWAATLTGRVGPVRTSVTTYVVPVVAIVLGVVFRDESVSAWAGIGIVIVLAGAFLSSRTD